MYRRNIFYNLAEGNTNKNQITMNQNVILVLAKQLVKWEAKFGRVITLEAAIEKENARMEKLSQENDFNF